MAPNQKNAQEWYIASRSVMWPMKMQRRAHSKLFVLSPGAGPEDETLPRGVKKQLVAAAFG